MVFPLPWFAYLRPITFSIGALEGKKTKIDPVPTRSLMILKSHINLSVPSGNGNGNSTKKRRRHKKIVGPHDGGSSIHSVQRPNFHLFDLPSFLRTLLVRLLV